MHVFEESQFRHSLGPFSNELISDVGLVSSDVGLVSSKYPQTIGLQLHPQPQGPQSSPKRLGPQSEQSTPVSTMQSPTVSAGKILSGSVGCASN